MPFDGECAERLGETALQDEWLAIAQALVAQRRMPPGTELEDVPFGDVIDGMNARRSHTEEFRDVREPDEGRIAIAASRL